MSRIPRSKQARKANTKGRKADASSHTPSHEPDSGSSTGGQSSSGGTGSSYSDAVDTYMLGEGKEEVIRLWDKMNRDERAVVLNVEAEEVIYELGLQGVSNIDDRVNDILRNSELMTAIRMSFVMGMENKGSMAVPREPIIICIVKICESHLLLAHVRHASMTRILAFTLYSIWSSSTWIDHWLLRYALCALLCGMAWTSNTKVSLVREKLRLYLLTPFEDRSPERMAASVEACLCAILSMCLADWVSWYKVMLVLVFLPLILVQVEKRISITETTAMRKIRIALMFIACTVLFYLSWYSWLSSLFVALFFFPTISGTILSVSLSTIGHMVMIYKDWQATKLDWTRTWILYTIIWLIPVLITLIDIITIDVLPFELSWRWYLPLCAIIIIMLPPLVADIFILACKGFAANIMAEGPVGAAWLTLNILWIYYLLRFRKRSNSGAGASANDYDTSNSHADATSTMDEKDQH